MALRLTRREWMGMSLGAAASLAGARPLLAGSPGSFHLGLVTYNVAKDWDLDTILSVLPEAGFEGVEFRTTHAHGVEIALGPAERAEVRDMCAAAGMKQVSLGTACEFQSPGTSRMSLRSKSYSPSPGIGRSLARKKPKGHGSPCGPR